MKDETYCLPSPQCTYCRARHACPALQATSLAIADISAAAVAWDLPPAHTGAELTHLEHAAMLLDARITGLQAQALSMIKSGNRVPGYIAETSMGRERWKVPAEEAIALGEMFGIALAKPAEIITPKQAIKAGLSPEIVKSYSETPTGAVKLVAENSTTVRKIFGG